MIILYPIIVTQLELTTNHLSDKPVVANVCGVMVNQHVKEITTIHARFWSYKNCINFNSNILQKCFGGNSVFCEEVENGYHCSDKLVSFPTSFKSLLWTLILIFVNLNVIHKLLGFLSTMLNSDSAIWCLFRPMWTCDITNKSDYTHIYKRFYTELFEILLKYGCVTFGINILVYFGRGWVGAVVTILSCLFINSDVHMATNLDQFVLLQLQLFKIENQYRKLSTMGGSDDQLKQLIKQKEETNNSLSSLFKDEGIFMSDKDLVVV